MSQDLDASEIVGTEEMTRSAQLSKREPDDLFDLDIYSNPEDEAINYLRQMIKLSKRKVRAKKLDNNGKVRWARAGIEASKILLYSGVIDRAERRRALGEQNLLKDTMAEILSKRLQEVST